MIKNLEIMARQKGIIKLKGNIGDITFFKTKDGFMAREKTGVDGKKVKSDPAFARTRENMEEFASISHSGKLLRDALRLFIEGASDSKMSIRLTHLMAEIKNLDVVSARGKRNVGAGMLVPEAKTLLKGFNFNAGAILGSILVNPFAVDTATGVITINGLIPLDEVVAPAGATHVTFSGCWAKVDFAHGTYDVQNTNEVNLPLDAVSSNVVLTPAAAPTGIGTNVYLLKVEFFQEVSGTQYAFHNGIYNALSMVEVS